MKNKYHDEGTKVFFGQEGNFSGHDIIRIILEQEQAAKFMVSRLWNFFAYENPDPELIDDLANEFRLNNYEIAPVLKVMFTSKEFYSKKAIRTQIKSPSQWLAGSCIALGIDSPDAGLSINTMRTLGQELFAPPNVKGWDGGYAWITTSSLTQRYNLAATLINHRPKAPKKKDGKRQPPLPYTVNTETVLPTEQRENSEMARNHLENRMYQAKLSGSEKERLNAFIGAQPPANEWTDAQVRNILHVMMSTPQYQLT